MVDDEEVATYPTPEAAALAEWNGYPNVAVHVVRVEFRSPGCAVVITDTVPSHPMKNYCERSDLGWVYTGDSSSNG